ncbi:5-azacytidine-induced protein 2 isoform X1 [Seriola lalandi dorsalis]|uniref:5-azacytidine-induced protein 2 isoform X1 n=1 Tax=Seriola lalandi dorsalis TaxID=1841481 RepID=UPI000C6F9421|nr:5-azacytidine-induced protein 2 isoform X1 [Seriola lalandi dorsalis]XP_023263259.1 5-azacytidine-induced protein 2 isoform X1 [Seriola lalandi dorsalis]XP_056236809.1 5-azacytidine-induced protein 2 isoform X1 [Seriola aureovittata]XP_056236810.1 5-azacytidine-induced protein 2 isoform X1 [Seriola aureovittata]XP_056236811.1 5-azacytidine-induced protein 2 isoform X1 [Seriola aureovittata]
MEPLAVDDDICILKHETAYTAIGESPVSVCAGDESVASHFALVTAYEDIKKRLRDTERENTLLRKRVKQLEDKLFRPEAPPSEGPQYVNKAFSAYRGIYIEKEDLQMELNKLKKEKSESERLLTEQLQAKELELLQLRTEMETSQGTVMKSLNSPQDYWQVDTVSTEVKIHKLQEELERVTLENSRLVERSGEEPHGLNGPDLDQTCDAKYITSERSMQQMCQALRGEVTRLHSELKHQTGLIRKLRPLIGETRQAASTVPIQCLDDMEKNNHPVPRAPVPRPPSAPPLPSCSGRPCPPVGGPSGTLLPDSLKEDCWYNGPWPSQSCSGEALVGSSACSVVLPPPPLNQASLDESSRSFPSPPKPSDAMFWEGHSAASNSSCSMGNCSPRSPPNTEWTKPY